MARGREAPHLSDLHGCAHPDFRLIGCPSGADVDNLLLRVDFRELGQGGAQPLSLGFLFPISKPRRLTFDFACDTLLGHLVSVC